MSEREHAVEAYEVDYECDAPGCGGVMRPTGQALMCNPPMYPHRCNRCRTEKRFRAVYPEIRYRRTKS